MASSDLFDSSIKVNFFFEDVGSSEADVKAAFKRLRLDEVDIVLGPIDTASTQTALLTNQRDPLAIIEPSAISDEIYGKIADQNWLFRMATTISQDNNALVELLARDKNSSIALVTGTDAYSWAARKTIALGLALRGIRNVSIYTINDLRSIRKSKPDVLVLASMEESVPFMNAMGDWVDGISTVYLVQGNLANYSMYSWAQSLANAQAIAPADVSSNSFKARLVAALNRPALLNSPNSPVLSLAKRIYDSVMLAGNTFRAGDSNLAFRNRLAQAKSDGQLLFTAAGYYRAQKYTVFRYGSNGLFSPVGIFDPDTP